MAPHASAVLGTYNDALSTIFNQVQNSLANHRKNSALLYKLHVQASNVTQAINNEASVERVGERTFEDVFITMVNRVLVVRKGPPGAERVARFIGAYIKFMNEIAVEINSSRPSMSTSEMDDEDDNTLATRFVSRVLKYLSQGFHARNKVVRFRVIHIISEIISYLGKIDEEIQTALRSNLIGRLSDKESQIRSLAVIALSKLIGRNEPSELEEHENAILEVLLDALCFDPSVFVSTALIIQSLLSYISTSEVRRSALVSVPLTHATIPTILTRTRDVDPVIRKSLLSSVLLHKLDHPKQLTVAQREKVIKDAIRDRETSVRVAGGHLIEAWFSITLEENGRGEEGIMDGVIAFLTLFDVIDRETIAIDALHSLFVTRPEILEFIVFSDKFWSELTPESALLSRIFIERCDKSGKDTLLEETSPPVLTELALLLQETYNSVLDLLQECEDVRLLGEAEEAEAQGKTGDELVQRTFILGQLLKIARESDYGDEIGRRKMFTVVRDMMVHEHFPDSLTEHCLDVLSVIAPNERELVRIVVEVVIDRRDSVNDVEAETMIGRGSQSDATQSSIGNGREKSTGRKKERHEMTPEERLKTDIVDMRCLTLCIAMLERIHGNFEDNSSLEGILEDLILPAVKRKELEMRTKGLVGLGLCGLIAKNMALKSFQLFLSQIQTAPEDLKVRILQVVFDMLMVYEQEFFGRSEEIAQQVITFLLQTLEAEDSRVVQAVICIGIAKLLLSGVVADTRVLTSLVLTYIAPTTAHNLELRQCLSYFFPVYCYSSEDNQRRIQSIFMTAYDLVNHVHLELDQDQEMISSYQLGVLMVDWTNPQKTVPPRKMDVVNAPNVHMDLAIDIVAALYDSERTGEDQKCLCRLLGSLHLDGVDERSLLKFHILLSHLQEILFEDPAVNKRLDRFKDRFNKDHMVDLERIDERMYLRDKDFQEVYAFIGLEIPQCDDSESNTHGPDRHNSPKSRMVQGFPHVVVDKDQSRVLTDGVMNSPTLNQVQSKMRASGSKGTSEAPRTSSEAERNVGLQISQHKPSASITQKKREQKAMTPTPNHRTKKFSMAADLNTEDEAGDADKESALYSLTHNRRNASPNAPTSSSPDDLVGYSEM